MPLNFPLNPYVGQYYTQGYTTWVYNGVQWVSTVVLGFRGSSGEGFQGSVGFQGSFGYQGSIGNIGFQGSAGFQGSSGFQGSFGFQGSLGFHGSTGFIGSVGFMGSLGQANVVFGDVAPTNPYTGLLWFDTNNALFTAYYSSANNWIAVNGGANGPRGFTGSIGGLGYTGSAGPSSLPVVNTSIVYIPTVSDIGDLISTSANVIINGGIFSQGHTFTIYNNSLSNTTISTNTNVTLIWAGVANTGQRILLPRGLASVICVNTTSNTFVISGNLL